MGEDGDRRAAICAVERDEGRYLREWVAYHRVLGFDEVLVYENDSRDDSWEVLGQLEQHGLVTRVRWSVPDDVAPQKAAYADALRRLGPDFGWAAFIDLDEFVVLPRHDTIHDFLDEFGHLDAIGINWKNFGSSGHTRYEPGLVIERFVRCSERTWARNRRVKSLARTKVIVEPGTHECRLRPPALYTDVAGETIYNTRTAIVRHDSIRLNHYYTKSREEWDYKRERGRGDERADAPQRKHWYPRFEPRDRNEAEESDILRRVPAVRELMERTMQAPPQTTESTGPPPPRESPRTDDEIAALARPYLVKTGWLESRRRGEPVDAQGRPLPGFTYAAIDFLARRMDPAMRVFEYGSGPSTLWWAARAATVTAVVHEHKLVERLTPSLPPNASLVEVPFAAGDPGYARAPREAGDLFDVIAVGGRDRGTCAVECLPALRDDGVVVLNHSNRRQYVPAHEALAAKGFRRLELTGHGPVDGSTWRTTVFYRPANCFGI